MTNTLDDLRSFLEQRFQIAYPELDTSPGSVADIEIITPLVNRFAPDPFDTPIDEFLRALLSATYPDLVLQKGEVIDDLGIKPNRIFLEPFRRQIVSIGRNQSLQDPSILNDREADALAKNYFATRRLGGFAVGPVRLLFSSPRFALIQPTNACFTSDGLRFFPVESQAITAEDMLFNQSGSLFYFDVVVRAEEQGDEYNVERNAIVGIEGAPEVVKVQNLVRFESGSSRESTEEFLSRVQRELTEKSLVVFRGIRARLLSLFDSVRSIAVIGHNDPEMMRDIVRGSPGETYAFGMLTAVNSASSIYAAANSLTNGTPTGVDFVAIGLSVGDVFRRVDLVSSRIIDHTVTEVVSSIQARVTPPPPDVISPSPFMILGPKRGRITLSDIPGGIVQPQTPNGEVFVENDILHIGGTYDVFVRAGDPQERFINLTAIRDAEPLHFGVDLESFGGEVDELVQITPKIEDAATTNAAYVGPGDATAVVYIKVLDSVSETTPWYPTDDDVGRYLELLGTNGAGSDFGMYEILSVGAEQSLGGQRAVPVTVSTLDLNTNTNTVGISDRSSTYDLDFRLVTEVSKKPRVRDRNNPQADFNGNQDGIGAEVGDSVVIENGADAGIYSIRRILNSLGTHDVLILDRNLTQTQTPSGAGDGSGLRYRLADDLQVDLVSPRVTKMPLGDVFPADDLQTVAGNAAVVFSSSSNPLLAGVEAGDTLEILEGDNQGLYTIQAPITSSGFSVSPVPQATAFNQSFSVYRSFSGIQRPLVRVSGVELLDSSNQPTGITVPYGKEVDVRVLGTFSNRAQGQNVESAQGEVVGGAPPLLLFRDASVNFLAQRVIAGNRLEIFEGASAGEYEIADVAPPLGAGSVHELLIRPESEGGKDFVQAETALRYRVGEPSVGICRLYFLEPTSVEVETGLSGGRLQFSEGGETYTYRFSGVEGKTILPAPGSGDSDPRDLRVVRNYALGGGQYETILEFTDLSTPDAFELELEVGDVLEVHEQIQFKDSSGTDLKDLGIFGTPAGLRTVVGSNRVSVPANSHIDFLQMGDLSGELVSIDSGPDAGIYTIRAVISSKVLELDAVMTATTVGIKGKETATLYDAEIIDVGGNPYLRDPTDAGQLPNVGEYVTIFEAASTGSEGTFQVIERDFANQRVRLDGFGGTFPVAAGQLTWIGSDSNTPSGVVEQPFTLYHSTAKEVQVTQVATKAPDVTVLGTGSVLAGLQTFQGGVGAFASVTKGDRLEVLSGTNAGVYPILNVVGDVITVYAAHPFSAVEVSVPYRVWGGIHGERRMITVGGFEGTDGKIDPGQNIIYRIRRPNVARLSSTEMEEQVDVSGLYYFDLQIESMGPGDNRNLAADSRLVVLNGLRADGYTYSVENNVLSFSMFEEVSLNFDRRFLPVGNSDLPENRTELSGRNIQIRYETSTTVQLIDSLLRSDAERVVVANPIARHFLPSFVRTRLVYSGGSSVQVTREDVEDFINSLGPLDVLQVSDLTALLSQRGATSVVHPIVLVSVTHDINRTLIVERSSNVLGGSEVPYAGSARISSFFADAENGLVITRQ